MSQQIAVTHYVVNQPPRDATRARALAALLLAAVLALPLPVFAFDHAHPATDAVLHRFVREGWVDYEAMKKDRTGLDAALRELAAVSKKDFDRWSRAEQIAYLVNLYNVATLALIVDNYPVKSIKDIGSFFRGPWKQEVVNLFGEKVTLDHVEHDILRKKYDEPRIHFALVCAAKGCPPLRSEAYVAARLDAQLDDQGRVFMATPGKNGLDREEVVLLSPIFKWFAADFEKKSGTVLAFVTPYFAADKQKALAAGGYAIEYTEYDWSLNEK